MDFFDNMPKTQGTEKIYGIITGTVLENYNKDYLGKVKVSYSFGETGKNTSGWVPISMPYVSTGAGMYFMPEVGTEVIISFIMGNLNKPVVVGYLYSEKVTMPTDLDHEKNTVKMIKTKGGHQITFGEEADKEHLTITSSTGITISLLDKEEQISISDKDKKNKILLDIKGGGITLDAEKTISLKIGGSDVISLTSSKATIAADSISLSGTQKLEASGQSTSISGSSMELSADASFKASTSGVMELKGSLVKLN